MNSKHSPEVKTRDEGFFAFLKTEIPLTVYAAIFFTMALLWIYQELHPDLTLGMFTELLGAAFTLFIVDTLLVRSKTRRWKVVRIHVDYLIARSIHRLRDGIAGRAFGFNPDLNRTLSESGQLREIRRQRALLLTELEGLNPEDLASRISEASLFSEDTYNYLNEKAGDLWEILNMKYAEYMDPDLVSDLIRLHTQIKNLCAHIRQYRKAEQFSEDADTYHRIARTGAGISFREVLHLVNRLKRQGYSEAADLGSEADARTDDPEPTPVSPR